MKIIMPDVEKVTLHKVEFRILREKGCWRMNYRFTFDMRRLPWLSLRESSHLPQAVTLRPEVRFGAQPRKARLLVRR